MNQLGKVLNKKGGSVDSNREWEVGNKSNYDEIDDERQLKR